MSLLSDGREIAVLHLNDKERITVGRTDVDKIEVYPEQGPTGWYPWFAVWSGGKIVSRVSSLDVVGVTYRKE